MGAEAPPTTWQVAESVLLDARQRGKLVSYARERFGIQPEDADDVLQETVLELIRQHAHVQNPAGFVFAIFRSRCCRFLEARRRSREVFASGRGVVESSSPPEGLERRLALREALQEVSSSCRRILSAYYVEGQSLTETARSLALRSSGVFKTMNRCLRRLRECLS